MNNVDEVVARPIVTIGNSGISLGAILIATAIIAFATLAIWLVRQLTVRAQRRLGEGRASTLYVAGQVARYVIVIAAIAAVI